MIIVIEGQMRNTETQKHRNTETPKQRNSGTTKQRNDEAMKQRNNKPAKQRRNEQNKMMKSLHIILHSSSAVFEFSISAFVVMLVEHCL
jgi:hypothetical protein